MKRIELTNEDAAIMGQISEFERLSYKEAHENDVMSSEFMLFGEDSFAKATRAHIEEMMRSSYDLADWEII